MTNVRSIHQDDKSSDHNADIIASNVSKEFGRPGKTLKVLDSISFQVSRGSFLAIVGPSGCGKTTLLRILAKLESATSGSVWLEPGQRQEGVAYIPQSALLFPWRTLLQNAILGLELKGPLTPGKLERVRSEIARFGLNGFENSYPPQLSGGMKQRVALIRALESQPRLLFCDEPFSAIDFVTRLEMNTQFKFMCRVQGITTVFVTHNIEEAIFLGDDIVVMSGRPARIVARYQPNLSVGSEDAVECRKAPEFAELFVRIWEDLRTSHVGKD